MDNFAIFYSVNNANDIKVENTVAAQNGLKRVSLSQLHEGIPLYGAQVSLTFNTNNQIIGIGGKWEAINRNLNVQPRLTQSTALERVKQHLIQNELNGQEIPSSISLTPDIAKLVLFNPSAYYSKGQVASSIHLAYYFDIQSHVFFVDAENGRILTNFSRIADSKDRETYAQLTPCSGLPGTLVLDESGAVGGATPDPQAQEAFDFAGVVYDYFFDTHGRDSYDNAGATIVSTVHGIPPLDLISILCCGFGGTECCCNQMNAVWHPTLNQMIYGDGGTDGIRSFNSFTAGLDIVAHELSHAVNQYAVLSGGSPSGLDYNGESGALNEAFSDIFGAMVDRDDWLIGEDLVISGYVAGALRNMEDPTNGGLYDPTDAIGSTRLGHQPHHYSNLYTGSSDAGGVHVNSGIINHMTYLLSDGGTHTLSNVTVIGIGRDAVEKIIYETLTGGYLTPTSNFLDMRDATLAATEIVFPGDAAKYASVWNAFVAVGICDGAIPGECTPYAPIDSRDPVTIALALDYSGSMNSAAEPGGRPKIDVLKDAVEIFLRTWEIFAVPGDQVGIVNFSSDVAPTSLALQELIPNVNSVVSSVRGETAGGYTAMGGALRVSLDGLSGASHPATILFTNGMQNVNPMALHSGGASGPYQIINGTAAQAFGGTSSIAPNPGVNLSSYGTPVHGIAIGRAIGDAYHQLLSDITTETSGLLHITNSPDTALREFYLNDLVHALSLNTIEMIDYRHVELDQGARLVESFELDKGINRAAFMVNWIGDAPKSIEKFLVRAPNDSIVKPTKWINGEHYSIAVFDFPYMQQQTALDPIGQWVIFSGDNIQEPLKCQVALIVDEKEIHYKLKAKPQTTWAGTPIDLSAFVTGEFQEPILGLSDVSVSIKRPNSSLGDVLSKTKGSGNGTITDDLPNKAAIKLNTILQNANVRNKLTAINDKVILTDGSSSGNYRNVFEDTNVPGLYQFTFKIKGAAGNYGTIERNKTISVMLKPKPSRDHSILNKTTNGKTLVLAVTPIDANGYYLGPSYEQEIKVSIDGIEVTNLTDMLDGSYVVEINSAKDASDIRVRTEVFGVPVYEGTAEDYGSKNERKWSLSAHAGYVFAGQNFGSGLNSGWGTEVDIEYALKRSLSLELVGGLYSFNGTASSNNFNIGGGTVYLKKKFSLPSFQPYIAAGPGFYATSNSQSYFSVSPGVGLTKQLSPKLSAELGVHYFWLFGNSPKLDFGIAKIGFKYKL
ncbi:MAG: M4 family metallopeptidase [Bacteroidota bacterium]